MLKGAEALWMRLLLLEPFLYFAGFALAGRTPLDPLSHPLPGLLQHKILNLKVSVCRRGGSLVSLLS